MNYEPDDKCTVCGERYDAHFVTNGKAECRPCVTYFTPCRHENRQGSMSIAAGGNSWSDSTCLDCGKRTVIGTPR